MIEGAIQFFDVQFNNIPLRTLFKCKLNISIKVLLRRIGLECRNEIRLKIANRKIRIKMRTYFKSIIGVAKLI